MTTPPDLRLLAPAIATWLVVLAQLRLAPVVGVFLAGVAAAAAVVLIAARRGRPLVAAVLVCVAAAAATTSMTVHGRTTGPVARAAAAGAAVTVEGRLTDDPRLVASARGGALAVRELVVARLRVERLEVEGRRIRLRARVLVLSSDRSWLGLLPSQRVRSAGLLRRATPGDDVAGLLSARGAPALLGRATALQRGAGALRAGLRRAAAPLPAAERGLLPGLVDGDVSGLPPWLKDDFRTVGMTHLTAVSGSNVAIVLGFVLLLCAWTGLPRRLRPMVALLALGAFVVLARPTPSVLRAAVMGGVALLALVTGHRRSALPALCGAVVLLLFAAPDLAVSAGFALSVLATAGLVLLAPAWRDCWARRLPPWLADGLAVPAAAQVACTPLIVALSGQFGVLAVPANVLAVPAVAPATVFGLGAAVVAPVSTTGAHALAWLAWLPAAWLVTVASTGARLPGATFGGPAGLVGAVLALLGILVVAVVVRRPLLRRVTAAACAGTCLAAAALWWLSPGWPPNGWFLVACDVGQGDALVLAAGPHAAMVVDTGPDPAAMARCLRRLRVRHVPLVLLTHLHADHVEGLPAVLREYDVGQVQIGPLDEPAIELTRIQQWLAERHVPLQRAWVGEQGQAGLARWQVLAPDHPHHGTNSDPNNSSLVLRLTAAGGGTILLTGDVEREAQQALLDLKIPLHADILKVPHHGSSHQLPAFLDAVGARLTLTSVGAGNPYGHPSAGTLQHVIARGARSYRTDRDGDVAFVSRAGALSASADHGNGTTARSVPPSGLGRIPGTVLMASAAELWRWPANWCGGAPPSGARAPPVSAVVQARAWNDEA